MLMTFKLCISLNTVWITLQKIFVSQLETMVFSSQKKTYPLAIFGFTTMRYHYPSTNAQMILVTWNVRGRFAADRLVQANIHSLAHSFLLLLGVFASLFAFIFYIHSIVRSIPFDTYFHSNVLIFILSISFSPPPPPSSSFAQLPTFSVFHIFDKYIYM